MINLEEIRYKKGNKIKINCIVRAHAQEDFEFTRN